MAKNLCLGISPLSEIGEELETDKYLEVKKNSLDVLVNSFLLLTAIQLLS